MGNHQPISSESPEIRKKGPFEYGDAFRKVVQGGTNKTMEMKMLHKGYSFHKEAHAFEDISLKRESSPPTHPHFSLLKEKESDHIPHSSVKICHSVHHMKKESEGTSSSINRKESRSSLFPELVSRGATDGDPSRADAFTPFPINTGKNPVKKHINQYQLPVYESRKTDF